MWTRILFVCSGNTCRSPMAEALARERQVDAESAGIDAHSGDRAAPYAVRAMRHARGINLREHSPRDVDDVTLSAFDRIVAMDATVAHRLRTEQDVNADCLAIWAIPDPYGGTLADYRYCLEEIDAALDRLLSA